jgi:hypothetical protein
VNAPFLTARYLDDGDGTGKLIVRVEANGFAGESGAYFSQQQIETFAAQLTEFPLKDRPTLSGGFYSKTTPGVLEQVHVALAVYPADRTGRIGVNVRLATEFWPGTRPESQHAVTLEILTGYEPLLRFSRELAQLVKGATESATLTEGGPEQ